MAKFAYKAKEGPDRIVEGVMDAEGRGEVIDRLQSMGYFPVSVLEENSLNISEGSDSTAAKFRISRRDLVIFTRQLSDLID
ncbi:MAG: hypothetical protein NTZ48_03225, partial [Candidatus Omnitrophica bacterium]|nr:hypothetical protein [Candidatus Omnitrophota bacterium]